MSLEEKIRHQITNKIACALHLAQEEHVGKSVDFQPLDDGDIMELAMQIEANLFIVTNSNAKSSGYKQKVRTVTFNLCDEKNPDFRFNVLKREIEP